MCVPSLEINIVEAKIVYPPRRWALNVFATLVQYSRLMDSNMRRSTTASIYVNVKAGSKASKQARTNTNEPFTSTSERGAANVSEPRLSKNPLLAAQLRSDNYYTPYQRDYGEYLEKFLPSLRPTHLITQKYVDAIFLVDLSFLERSLRVVSSQKIVN